MRLLDDRCHYTSPCGIRVYPEIFPLRFSGRKLDCKLLVRWTGLPYIFLIKIKLLTLEHRKRKVWPRNTHYVHEIAINHYTNDRIIRWRFKQSYLRYLMFINMRIYSDEFWFVIAAKMGSVHFATYDFQAIFFSICCPIF